MKKSLFYFISLFLVAVMMIAAVPLYAADDVDLYTPAANGDLLYTVNFNGDEYWQPAVTQGSINVTPLSNTSAEIVATTNKAQNWYGGEIKGLPLENNAYTIKFTVTRNEKACFGLYVDSIYGVYGYAEQYKLMNVSSTLLNHAYIKYETAGLDIAGTLNDGTPQNYALEVNGQSYTLKLYIMDTKGDYQLVDESVAGEILCFATDNLGLFFYVYYAEQHSILSDVEVYKGMTLSGETLLETTTEVETTTAAPETTTAAPETTTTVPDTTTATPVTTQTPENTAAPEETTTTENNTPTTADEKGCGSLVTGVTGMVAIAAAAAYCFRKKK